MESEDDSEEEKETDYDIAEYEPETCNEAERPPQVRPDTRRFSGNLHSCVARLGLTLRLTCHPAIAIVLSSLSRSQCGTDQNVICAWSLKSFL